MKRRDVALQAMVHAQPPHLTYLSHVPRYRSDATMRAAATWVASTSNWPRPTCASSARPNVSTEWCRCLALAMGPAGRRGRHRCRAGTVATEQVASPWLSATFAAPARVAIRADSAFSRPFGVTKALWPSSRARASAATDEVAFELAAGDALYLSVGEAR